MGHEHVGQPDYGTGQKKLSVYVFGAISCVILTLVAFWAVLSGNLTKAQVLTVIFLAALIQFFVQVLCFLRLNAKTEQGQMNVLSLVFTVVILVSVVAGTLWIMWSLDYFMMN